MAQNRPVVSVRVFEDGRVSGEPRDVSDRVIRFRYEDEQGKSDRCDITVDNNDLSQFDDPSWRVGGFIEVTWGYAGNMSSPRRVVIQKVRGSRELRVEGHGLDMLMHKVKKSRVFKKKTLYDITKEILIAHEGDVTGRKLQSDFLAGLGPDTKTLKIDVAHQSAQTDATFLSVLAQRHGYVFFLDDKTFRMQTRDATYKERPTKKLVWFNGDGEWLDFDYQHDVTQKPEKVTKKGVDPAENTVFEASAGNPDSFSAGLAPHVGVETLHPGSPVGEMLEKKKELAGNLKRVRDGFAQLKTLAPTTSTSTTADAPVAGGVANRVLGMLEKAKTMVSEATGRAEEDRGPFSGTSEKGAKAHADGKYKRKKPHQLTGKTVGDPDFRKNTVLTVSGLGNRLSGLWALTSVEHEIDSGSGYLCSFKAERDGDNGYGKKGDANSKAKLNSQKEKDKEKPVPGFLWHTSKGGISSKSTLEKHPFFAGFVGEKK